MRRSVVIASSHTRESPLLPALTCQISFASRRGSIPYHSFVSSCSSQISNPLQRYNPPQCCARASTSSAASRSFTTGRPHRRAETLSRDTHYEFFPETFPQGPPPSGRFHIDLRQLRNEFLQLQARAHPDRHAGDMKARAEALSSRINEAYKTLKEPLARAQYILALNGVDVEDEAGQVDDMELLGLVMEAREEIEDAQSEEELKGLRKENEERLGETVEKLGRLLEKGEWDDARAEAVKLRYWVNVRESLEAWKPGEGVPNLIH